MKFQLIQILLWKRLNNKETNESKEKNIITNYNYVQKTKGLTKKQELYHAKLN